MSIKDPTPSDSLATDSATPKPAASDGTSSGSVSREPGTAGPLGNRGGPARAGFTPGLVAGAAAALVMLVFRVIVGTVTVPELLLDQITTIVPPVLFALVLDTLKFLAKPLLMAGLVAGQLVLSGLGGMLYDRQLPVAPTERESARWPRAAGLGFGVWLVAEVILLPLLGAGFFGTFEQSLALAVAALAYASSLVAVDRWTAPSAPGELEKVDRVGRRAVLRTVGFGALALGAGAFLLRGASLLTQNAQAAQRSRRPADSLPPEVTPTADFYVVSKNLADPSVDANTWKLEIAGLVDRPLTFTYDQLKALPAVEQYVTLSCISNDVGGDLISNAKWKGVRLADLLKQAGPNPGVQKVFLNGFDDYTDSITLDRALLPDNIIAYEMNGEPLLPGHGYPARLLVPGIYGMKNVKWLTGIHLVDYDVKGYWQQRGWSDPAPVKTISRIDVPSRTTQPPAGPLEVGGIAFSGDRGISRVEVSTDGGKTWQPAQLRPALSPDSWVLWTLNWQAPVGRQTLVVRAADGTGTLQSSEEASTLPDGASGYHKILVNIVAESGA